MECLNFQATWDEIVSVEQHTDEYVSSLFSEHETIDVVTKLEPLLAWTEEGEAET